MFSSATAEWSTPQDFFDELNKEFGFNLDPCCTHENAKCEDHYTKEDNGLEQNWGGRIVFVNPPYGKGIGLWVKKSYEESLKAGTTVVMLIPARTDTRYFHEYIYHKAQQIRFIRGRLKFGGSDNSAPFPSMVVIFKRNF